MSLISAPLVLSAIGNIALSILAIGFLIFVHELGHFLACRATKTRVETFSIGFGPRLFGWERPKGGRRRFTVGARRLSPQDHAMDVRIAAIPLGGYVKMAGEIVGDATPGDPRAREPRAPAADEFPGKPFGSRFLIIVAGVAMNAVTALALLCVAYGIGVAEPEPVLGTVVPGGPAWQAGLAPGDRIVSIGARPMRSFLDVRMETPLLRAGAPVAVEIERAGSRQTVQVRPEMSSEDGILQLQIAEALVWTIGEGDAAFVVGPADRIAVGGRVVVGGAEAAQAAQDAFTLGRTSLRIERLDGSGRSVEVSPKTKDAPAARRIGVVTHDLPVVEAVRADSAAARAGLLPNDRVLGADGVAIARRELPYLQSIARLDVRRDGETKAIEVGATDREAVAAFLRDVAFRKPRGAYVDVDESFPGGSPAAAAGVRSGDLVLEVDGDAVGSIEELAKRVQGADEPIRLKVKTGDEAPRDVTVTPREAPSTGWPGTLEAARTTIGGSGVGEALALGSRRTLREFTNLFRMLRSFFTGDIRVEKGVGGPGTLVSYSEKSLQAGFTFFLVFLAIISVNLAVLNILPIPVLDGGQLLFLVIEKLRGRPLKEATIAKAQLVGLFLLLALMAFAISNDFRLLL